MHRQETVIAGGCSWQEAFHTIQAALLAVPDDKGGHRIIVRPDTYVEANLYPAHKGAAGADNLMIGDCDGRLGSGTQSHGKKSRRYSADAA